MTRTHIKDTGKPFNLVIATSLSWRLFDKITDKYDILCHGDFQYGRQLLRKNGKNEKNEKK